MKFPIIHGDHKEWAGSDGCAFCGRVQMDFSPEDESVTIHLGAILHYDEPRPLGKIEIDGGDDEKMTAYLSFDWQSACGPQKYNFEPDHYNVVIPIAEKVARGQGRIEFCSVDCLEKFFAKIVQLLRNRSGPLRDQWKAEYKAVVKKYEGKAP